MSQSMSQSIFRSPYNTWSAEEVLGYYQQHTHIHYFPLRDAEQAAPEKIAWYPCSLA